MPSRDVTADGYVPDQHRDASINMNATQATEASAIWLPIFSDTSRYLDLGVLLF